MDLVVRTPHGDADLSVVSSPDTATLADLVEVATGQVAPPLVRIDDRPIDAATRLRDAPLLIGSVVSSHPAAEETSTRTAVQLLQLAGSGAGTVRTLEAGRYRHKARVLRHWVHAFAKGISSRGECWPKQV